MGRRTERWRGYVDTARAQAKTTAAEDSRKYYENVLSFGEQQLGSDEQVAGTGQFSGQDSRMQQYTQRYEADAGILGAMGGSGFGHDDIMQRGIQQTYFDQEGITFDTMKDFGQLREGDQGGIAGYGNRVAEAANDLLGQAQKAAEGGDWAAAEKFRSQAEGLVANSNPSITEGARWNDVFSLDEGSAAMAGAQKLTGKQAQTVGALVRDARAFQDWDSEGSQRMRRNLTANAERGISQAERGAQRQMRDLAASRGGARAMGAEMAIRARSAEGFAQQIAQVHTEADQYFESYRREFAVNVAGFAQAWLQNQSGIRESFQGALDAIRLSAAGFHMQSAELSTKNAELSQQMQIHKDAETRGYVPSLLGIQG